MKFVKMNKPLEYPVYNGKTVVIPAGAKNVKIAFRQSHLTRFDENTNKTVPLNVYIYGSSVIHA